MLILGSVIGGLIGWAIGVLATPTSEKEVMQFNAYAKLVSGFLSGYLFTKLNDLLSGTSIDKLFPHTNGPAQVGYACGYTFAFFLIGLMWTFVVRRYEQTLDAPQTAQNGV